jgi:hypothetical protein
MFTHSLSWPEITTLLAALGLVMNASISFYISQKKSASQPNGRSLQPLRAQAKRTALNHGHSRLY